MGSSFFESSNLQEIYVPASVREIGSIKDNDENDIDVYIYSDQIDDIEDLCCDARLIYVMPEAYGHYKELMDDIDTDAKLKKMPSEKLNFYQEYFVTEPEKSEVPKTVEPKAQTVESMTVAPPMPQIPQKSESIPTQATAAQAVKSPGNLFSDGLKELINSVAESDELTDKKKEIDLRRAIKEGEDSDEVEMVLEARFFEAHNK